MIANRTLSGSVPNCVVKSHGINSIPGQAIKKSLTQMGSTVNTSTSRPPPGTLWQLFGGSCSVAAVRWQLFGAQLFGAQLFCVPG